MMMMMMMMMIAFRFKSLLTYDATFFIKTQRRHDNSVIIYGPIECTIVHHPSNPLHSENAGFQSNPAQVLPGRAGIYLLSLSKQMPAYIAY